jgi:hypothetical protein
MILVIRGHIRNAFETQQFYNFIKSIYELDPNLKIFIHTWNKFANNISWRHIDTSNNTIITKEIIFSYFKDLQHLIKEIIIDDDLNITLIGNLKGNINNGPMPILGWKNYWYGKYRIIDYIYKNTNTNKDEMIVNIRFDILNNSNSFDEKMLIEFIKNNFGIKFIKNVFLYDSEVNGIDNIYIGNINTMHRLISNFYYDLDDILNKNNDVYHQEILVYRINKHLFNI